MNNPWCESCSSKTGKWIDADILMIELQKDADIFDEEAQDALKNPQNCTDNYRDSVMGRANGLRDAMIEIYDAPSIDIVHCCECEFEWTQKCPPHRMGLIHDESDYCSYGIRRADK